MAFKLGMMVDLCMAYMLMLVFLMTLTRSQWIGRAKQCLSYDIQTAHDGRLVHDMYAPVCLYDLENISKAYHSSSYQL